MKRLLAVVGISLTASCSHNNNLLLGRVEARVGTHDVLVTDCYRTRVPEPRRLADEAGAAVWRYIPCKDADIWIRGSRLNVNGRDYGEIGPQDRVLVDHGAVSVEHPRMVGRVVGLLADPLPLEFGLSDASGVGGFGNAGLQACAGEQSSPFCPPAESRGRSREAAKTLISPTPAAPSPAAPHRDPTPP